MKRRASGVAITGACVLPFVMGAVARAAGPQANMAPAPASAQALYEEGRKAASDKDWTLACTKFRASQAVEAAPGTLLNLGDCEENLGQLVQADQDFTAAAQAFRGGDSRIEYAKKRAKAVEARLAHLSLHFAAGTPADATVERDGAPVDAATLGTNVAVDPGAHSVVVHAGGRTDVRSDITLAEGQSTVLALTAGAAIPASVAATPVAAPAAPPVATGAPGAPGAMSPAMPPAATPIESRPLFGAGIAVTAIGGAGLAFGLIAGAITLSKKSAVDDECPTTCTNQKGLDDESSGKTWSTLSTVSVIAGAAVGAAGLTMVLLNLKPSSPNATSAASRITVGPVAGGGQLGWSGSF